MHTLFHEFTYHIWEELYTLFMCKCWRAHGDRGGNAAGIPDACGSMDVVHIPLGHAHIAKLMCALGRRDSIPPWLTMSFVTMQDELWHWCQMLMGQSTTKPLSEVMKPWRQWRRMTFQKFLVPGLPTRWKVFLHDKSVSDCAWWLSQMEVSSMRPEMFEWWGLCSMEVKDGVCSERYPVLLRSPEAAL